MRSIFVFLLAWVLIATALGQSSYAPKQGETVLRINIDGKGSIYIKLHTKEAPRTTSQIIELANEGFYNGQRVFRSEKSPRPFMIQMGDPNTKTKPIDDPTIGSGGSGRKIPYEDSGFLNEEGSVGLAAIPGDKNSGDSQFYILLARARILDGSYTVFGKVVAGMDVVRKVERNDRISTVTVLR